MNKTTKIVIGTVAALGLLGGGTALAIAHNAVDEESTSASSVSVVSPGTAGGTAQQPGNTGQPPGGMGQPGGGMQGMPPGGGPVVDALTQALGLDAETVSAAVQEVETELNLRGPEASQSAEFAEALATKLGVSADEITSALAAMPQPGQGGMGQPGQGGMGQPPSGSTGSAPQIQVPSGAATPSTGVES